MWLITESDYDSTSLISLHASPAEAMLKYKEIIEHIKKAVAYRTSMEDENGCANASEIDMDLYFDGLRETRGIYIMHWDGYQFNDVTDELTSKVNCAG